MDSASESCPIDAVAARRFSTHSVVLGRSAVNARCFATGGAALDASPSAAATKDLACVGYNLSSDVAEAGNPNNYADCQHPETYHSRTALFLAHLLHLGDIRSRRQYYAPSLRREVTDTWTIDLDKRLASEALAAARQRVGQFLDGRIHRSFPVAARRHAGAYRAPCEARRSRQTLGYFNAGVKGGLI